jgi:hypothetical protein
LGKEMPTEAEKALGVKINAMRPSRLNLFDANAEAAIQRPEGAPAH